ncbi:MAG: M20/M25/M40 family metallo-hydrolase [Holosporales bacterium]|nr:M20/M25/M40 family metallo-hydrolase [Holosporales bacterium]
MYSTVKLLSELVSSTSVGQTIECLSEKFLELGFAVKKLNFNGTENLYACKNLERASELGNKTIMYLGHADVVPLGEGWTFEQGTVVDGAVWGRGTVDMKGSIVCFLDALRLNPDASVAVIISGDEEGSAEFGTPMVIDWLKQSTEFAFPKIDFVLIGEPTSYRYIGDCVKVGGRGSLNVTLKANGIAGHVAYPQFLKNPIYQMIRLVNEITAPCALSKSEYIGLPTDAPENKACVYRELSPQETQNVRWDMYNLEITSFESNSGAVNVVPGMARCRFNIRFGNDVSGADLIVMIDSFTRKHGIQAEYDLACQPFCSLGFEDLRSGSAVMHTLLNSVESVTGKTPQVITGGANSDAKFIYKIAPFAELGLKVDLAHKCDEHVSFEDLTALTCIYDRFIEGLRSELRKNKTQ